MGQYLMALDAGTTSNRCIIFDRQGKVISFAQKTFEQHYPRPGWVEHDAEEIWETMLEVSRRALEESGLAPSDIAGIGITNQRETTVVWDKETGKPVCCAIVWQCRRTAEYCSTLAAKGLTYWFKEKTGLLPDPYFSGTKLRWILENVPGTRERALRGELLFGTIETWLIWNLSGGTLHVTDYSNASRTLLYNIRTLEWDEEILEKLEIPAQMLPEVRDSSCVYGMTDPSVFGEPIPIAGAAGDQQAALFGQACFAVGEAKNTYGTGGFLLMNTGEVPVASNHGLLTTIAWGIDGKVTYALEGSVFIAGAAIQWLRDGLGLISSARESEEAALSVEDTDGCYVVPAFTGLGAPYWDPYARGAIIGLTRGTTKYHVIRATLDSIAYQINGVLQAMESDMGGRLVALNVDGGASANNYLMQCQADLSDIPVIRPQSVETTAAGAAYLAGLAVGVYENPEDIRRNRSVDRIFEPQMEEQKRTAALAGWEDAVRRVRG